MTKHIAKGFSLIELLVSTAITAIIGSAVLLLLITQTQLTATQNRNMLNADQVRSVMNFMSDEIEMMGNGTPAPWIETAIQQEIQFRSDIDGDGRPDRIRYFLNGSQLQRTLSTSNDNGVTWTVVGTDTLIPNIDTVTTKNGKKMGLWFTYYAKDGAVPANTAQITAVEINLGLNVASTTTALTRNKVAPQYFVSLATIRNRSL
jgi:prepilin-type N-terminal cleavage/methylation domain-containing protein